MINSQYSSHFEVISEKILPEKIKNIVWHKKIDLIIINCGKYYEVHRIGFKHEEIFKKEEKCEIKEILVIDQKKLISVVLEDCTITFVNFNNGEIVLKVKEKPSQIASAQLFLLESDDEKNSVETLDSQISNNPFKDDLNFNSFSKIDVSEINFFHSNFHFSHFFVYNSLSNEIEFYLKFLVNYTKFHLPHNPGDILFLSAFSNTKMLYLAKSNEGRLLGNFVLLNYLNEKENINSMIFQISFSISIIDYITQILSIFTRIISKLGITFWDKYMFANGLEHEVNAANENNYLNMLNTELKKWMHLGIISPNLRNLLKQDLFEGRSIIKMDENIHFNLKNIEDIIIENIKPCLNTIGFYLNQLNSNPAVNSIASIKNNLLSYEEGFTKLFLKFQEFMAELVLLKSGYRNFLAWINSFNNSTTSNNANDNSKNYLNTHIIDFDKLFTFIDKSSYNMRHISQLIDRNEDIPCAGDDTSSSVKQGDTITASILNNTSILQYIQENGVYSLFTAQDCHKKEKETTLGIKALLQENKSKLISLKLEVSQLLATRIEVKNLFEFAGINLGNIITGPTLYSTENDENSHILFRYADNVSNHRDMLVILKIRRCNTHTHTLFISKVNFTYENNIQIINFQLYKSQDIILLVKSISLDNEDTNTQLQVLVPKYSIIISKLDNYAFAPFDSVSDFSQHTSIEDIKIDKFIDVDCSDNSFLTTGERGLIALVDNSKNKLTIIDIQSD